MVGNFPDFRKREPPQALVGKCKAVRLGSGTHLLDGSHFRGLLNISRLRIGYAKQAKKAKFDRSYFSGWLYNWGVDAVFLIFKGKLAVRTHNF